MPHGPCMRRSRCCQADLGILEAHLVVFFLTYITSNIAASDENGRKRTEKPYFYFRFYIFLAETESGSENTSSKTKSEYADIRKRTNTDGEPKN
jgi:hypothetical protein